MPKGYKTKKVSDKEEAREALRQIVLEKMRPMVEAQIAVALGIQYLGVRDKAGKFTKLTKDKAGLVITKGDEILELWDERPSTPAFSDLMDRALDMPIRQIQGDHNVHMPEMEAILQAIISGRKRVSDGKRGS